MNIWKVSIFPYTNEVKIVKFDVKKETPKTYVLDYKWTKVIHKSKIGKILETPTIRIIGYYIFTDVEPIGNHLKSLLTKILEQTRENTTSLLKSYEKDIEGCKLRLVGCDEIEKGNYKII